MKELPILSRRRLVGRSLAHYRRTHAGVVAGTALAAAVLTGALIVGDSVRHTLREQALDRIGDVDQVVATGDRFFRADLSDRVAGAIEGARVAPVAILRGIASLPGGERVARGVNVLGVDDRFFALARSPSGPPGLSKNEILINERLARHLEVASGDELVLRIEQPSALPRDSVLGTVEDIALALRVTVRGIAGHEAFGRFGLQADQLPPANLFIPIETLQAALDLDGRGNLLLIDSTTDAAGVDAAVATNFQLADAQLEITDVPGGGTAELVSDRIFLDAVVERAAVASGLALDGVVTYFVNAIEHGDSSTPYSMVTAIGPLTTSGIDPRPVPKDLRDGDIVINDWLAADLECGVGDELSLRYYVLDDDDRLIESSTPFTVRSIVPMSGLAADRTLMPDFPGIADAEASRDWEPGIPIDLGRIRQRDEDYWDAHRGTPKAFVSLAAGRSMWSNRYGDLTAIRFDRSQAAPLRDALRSGVHPSALGFDATDVRDAAVRASRATTDFGGLFLGLSFFLIFSALLLTALLFVFSVEQRAREIGTLEAMGFRRRSVRGLLLAEGAILALAGSVVGALAGVGYTQIVLRALAGVWSDAVAAASIELHVSPVTVALGGVASFAAACLTMRLTLGRVVRIDPVVLLAGNVSTGAAGAGPPRRLMTGIVAAVALLGAVGIALAVGADSRSAAPAFFAAGALMLTGGIALCRLILVHLRQPPERARASTTDLALRGTTRRLGRSLATTSLLASGVFLVLAVAVNQLDAHRGTDDRSSGTGGFALIGTTTLPIHLDLDTPRGRDVFGLTEVEMEGVSVVSMRVHDGDDASCLNLNTAQHPRVLGVIAEQLATRDAFRFVKAIDDERLADGWRMLDHLRADGAIPAIADHTSATWAMHRSVGDTFEYVDGAGRAIELVLVGTVANSILQGNLLIADDRFRAVFPADGGFRSFLVDAPPGDRARVANRLGRALSDVGLDMTPAPDRLAEFSSVQNTYLSIFQMLGGLGVLLGTIGLGIVVVRNALERRGELALLNAVGFSIARIRRLVVGEHVFLLVLGVACGAIAALVAVIPAIGSATLASPIPFAAVLVTLLLANGLLWVWLAVRLAVTGSVVRTLGEEG